MSNQQYLQPSEILRSAEIGNVVQYRPRMVKSSAGSAGAALSVMLDTEPTREARGRDLLVSRMPRFARDSDLLGMAGGVTSTHDPELGPIAKVHDLNPSTVLSEKVHQEYIDQIAGSASIASEIANTGDPDRASRVNDAIQLVDQIFAEAA